MVMIVKDYTKLKEKADLLKALGHPVRLCITRNLLGGECNVSYMQECLGLPQPTISQHLAILRRAGIIAPQRKGTEINYTVVNEDIRPVILALFKER